MCPGVPSIYMYNNKKPIYTYARKYVYIPTHKLNRIHHSYRGGVVGEYRIYTSPVFAEDIRRDLNRGHVSSLCAPGALSPLFHNQEFPLFFFFFITVFLSPILLSLIHFLLYAMRYERLADTRPGSQSRAALLPHDERHR